MIYLILAMILYSAAALFGVAAARAANTNLVSAVTNTIAALVPVMIIMPALVKKSVSFPRYGLTMAVFGGVCIGLFVMALNKSFTLNKVGVIMPIIFGGAIFLTSVLSYFLFKEKINLLEGVGLALVLAGLLVVIYARATLAQPL